MQIDDTTARWLVGLTITAIGSVIVATWRTARLSRDGEKALDDYAALSAAVFGDEKRDPPIVGLRSRLRAAERTIAEQAKVLRAICRALRIPPTSDEHAIVEAVQRALAEHSAPTFAAVAAEDTGAHRRAQLGWHEQADPLPPPAPRRRPPLPTTYGGDEPGGEDGER